MGVWRSSWSPYLHIRTDLTGRIKSVSQGPHFRDLVLDGVCSCVFQEVTMSPKMALSSPILWLLEAAESMRGKHRFGALSQVCHRGRLLRSGLGDARRAQGLESHSTEFPYLFVLPRDTLHTPETLQCSHRHMSSTEKGCIQGSRAGGTIS